MDNQETIYNQETAEMRLLRHIARIHATWLKTHPRQEDRSFYARAYLDLVGMVLRDADIQPEETFDATTRRT